MNNKLKRLKNLKLIKHALDALLVLKEISEKKQKRIRSCSVKAKNRDRKKKGFFVLSFLVVKEIDHQQFFIYTRMTPQVYELLLLLIKPYLQKSSLREPVQPECRLALTLLYLSQGTAFQLLAESFKLGKETVRRIVLETTEVLWSMLSNPYVCEPKENDYKEIAKDFWQFWNMPNCIGAIDGKHIAVQCPNSGSQFFCYNKLLSIVLLAACDARYMFTHVDIGTYGNQSDGGMFQLSRFGKRLLSSNLPIPPPNNLPNTHLKVPHFFVGGPAFPLGTNLMSPYPGELLPKDKEVFNKRLSRAHRTIENAFGILISRWRVLLTTLHLHPTNVEKIVLACVALHNFIMLNEKSSYVPNYYVDWEDSNGDHHDGSWRSVINNNVLSITPFGKSQYYGGKTPIQIRNSLCKFFSSC